MLRIRRSSRARNAAQSVFVLGNGLCNLWAEDFEPVRDIGTNAVTNVAGDFVLGSGTFGRGIVSYENIGVGATISWRFKSSDGAVSRGFSVEYRNGALSDFHDSTSFTYIGNGYWTAQHTVDPAKGAINQITLYADNRVPVTDLTISEIVGVIGTQLPVSIAEISSPSNELVVVQVPGAVRVFVPSGSRYIEYRMLRTDDASVNAKNWAFQFFWAAKRIGNFGFTRIAHLGTGENTLAILQSGKSDFMGGLVHGDQLDDGPGDFARLLINGSQQTIDGLSAFRCERAELLTHTHLVEVGVGPPYNTLAGVTTSHAFDKTQRTLTLTQEIIWGQSITLTTSYLAMLAVFRTEAGLAGRPVVTQTLTRSPDWVPEDVSVVGPVINGTSSSFKITGTYALFEVDVLSGWTDPSRQFLCAADASVGPKCYFNAYLSHATSIGETWNFSAQYRMTVN